MDRQRLAGVRKRLKSKAAGAWSCRRLFLVEGWRAARRRRSRLETAARLFAADGLDREGVIMCEFAQKLEAAC